MNTHNTTATPKAHSQAEAKYRVLIKRTLRRWEHNFSDDTPTATLESILTASMHKEDQTCEGYANYETSVIGLEMNNDKITQDRWIMAARNANDTSTLAEEMKIAFESKKPDLDDNWVYAALLNASLSEVNWYELAEEMVQKNAEREESEA